MVLAASARAQTLLPIPPVLTGPDIALSIQEGITEFHPGEPIPTYGYNGALLGPTLLLVRGQAVTINVTNHLPDLTTTHWHGLHVSPENDGGPHSRIYPDSTWSPSFTVMNRAGTYWYHPHGIGLTDYQVSKGLAGLIIVQDAQEAALALPRTYGVDDIPLILQTKPIVAGEVMMHTGLDSVVITNGVRDAWKELPAQVVRLRCLNGSSERAMRLGFSNGMVFHVIGTDGGLLDAPVALTRLQLMPGERVELLLDLAAMQGQAMQLMAYNSELPDDIIGAAEVGNGMATLDGYDDNALNGADFPLVSFTVGAPLSNGTFQIPNTLVPVNPISEVEADLTRTFLVEPQFMSPMEMIEGPFTINGALMDMDSINVVVPLGSTEIWTFTNNTMVGHPIHIHDIQFNILDRNGAAPEPWETGWKDVVFVPAQGSARVITRFEDFADPDMPYMYHCHLLMHEDEGMMGQFLVVDPTSIGEALNPVRPVVWPNPSSTGHLVVSLPIEDGPADLRLYDALGRIAFTGRTSFTAGKARVVLPALAAGDYQLRITDQRGIPYAAHVILQH